MKSSCQVCVKPCAMMGPTQNRLVMKTVPRRPNILFQISLVQAKTKPVMVKPELTTPTVE